MGRGRISSVSSYPSSHVHNSKQTQWTTLFWIIDETNKTLFWIMDETNKNEFVHMSINRNAFAHILAKNDFARGIYGLFLSL